MGSIMTFSYKYVIYIDHSHTLCAHMCCLCVSTHVCIDPYVCLCMYKSQVDFLSCSLPHLLMCGVCGWTHSLPFQLVWQASSFQGTCPTPALVWHCKRLPCHLAFFRWGTGDLNSSPHACTPSTLSPSHLNSPHPYSLLLSYFPSLFSIPIKSPLNLLLSCISLLNSIYERKHMSFWIWLILLNKGSIPSISEEWHNLFFFFFLNVCVFLTEGPQWLSYEGVV